MKNEVVSVVCKAMFGEESVNNLVTFFSRGLVAFSGGQISALVAQFFKSRSIPREDFVHDYHTSTGARRQAYAALRTILVLFVGCAVTHASLA